MLLTTHTACDQSKTVHTRLPSCRSVQFNLLHVSFQLATFHQLIPTRFRLPYCAGGDKLLAIVNREPEITGVYFTFPLCVCVCVLVPTPRTNRPTAIVANVFSLTVIITNLFLASIVVRDRLPSHWAVYLGIAVIMAGYVSFVLYLVSLLHLDLARGVATRCICRHLHLVFYCRTTMINFKIGE